MRIPITKMHGARNDFVILDRRKVQINDLASFARWVCDRHGGVGADGVIALESDGSALAMRTINADGSEAEMCGNGVRCAARWLDEAGECDNIAFQTPAGSIRAEIVSREPVYSIRVAMGRLKEPVSRLEIPANASFVDLGNPHVVILVGDVEGVDLERLAMQLQKEPTFPSGTNVHVAMRKNEHTLCVRHWERGVGLTLACGTGAVASAAAAIDRDVVRSPVDVIAPGGRLVVECDPDGECYLTGPAVRVFDAEVNVDLDRL